MKTSLLAVSIAFASLTLPTAFAGDSTGQVVSSLNQSENFSSSSGKPIVRYNGSTTGRVGIGGGKTVIVNGHVHNRGSGVVTRIPLSTTIGYTTGCTPKSAPKYGSATCSYESRGDSVSCDIVITDSYVQGCKISRTSKKYSCYKSKSGGDNYRANCRSLGTETVSVSNEVHTVIESY